MQQKELTALLDYLTSKFSENEWIEFKLNFHSPEEIGERISALSNSAKLNRQPFAYLVYGIEDETRKILGTTFKAKSKKKGNELLEMWLSSRLSPNINFETYEFDYAENIHISLYKIPASINQPIFFNKIAYARVGSATVELVKHPEKQRELWKDSYDHSVENSIVKSGLSPVEVLSFLSSETYFDLIKRPKPQDIAGELECFIREGFLVENNDNYDITYLGAILFAKKLSDFAYLPRKAIRVIVYKGKNKIETIREQIGTKGYAVGYSAMIDWINGQLPENEEIGKSFRKNVKIYPELAIRELVSNCIIHQDLSEKGFPMIEIYSDRIEISNPGNPLIKAERFIDEYQSRNDKLANIMRRMGFCEEKGSGLDKTIFQIELYQLPAVKIEIKQTRTILTIYSYRELKDTDKDDRIRACYQHACLKYLSSEKMTNKSLRERFKISDENSAMASRIIKDSLNANLIKESDPNSTSRKNRSYLPFWA